MVSRKARHILDVVFCTLGTVSGLSGGISFSTFLQNDAAALWAFVSGALALVCLVLELMRYHAVLHVLYTKHTLLASLLVSMMAFCTSLILTVTHLCLAIQNGEPFPSTKNNINHSDYIIAVWTFLTCKYSLKLAISSARCRKIMRQEQARLTDAGNSSFTASSNSLQERQGGEELTSSSHRSGGGGLFHQPYRQVGHRSRRSSDRLNLILNAEPLASSCSVAQEQPDDSSLGTESVADMEAAAEILTRQVLAGDSTDGTLSGRLAFRV